MFWYGTVWESEMKWSQLSSFPTLLRGVPRHTCVCQGTNGGTYMYLLQNEISVFLHAKITYLRCASKCPSTRIAMHKRPVRNGNTLMSFSIFRTT